MRKFVASLVAIGMAAVTLVTALDSPASAAPTSPYDPTWAPGSSVPGVSFASTFYAAEDIAVLPDGRMYATMTHSAPGTPGYLVRLTATGEVDGSFSPIDLGLVSGWRDGVTIDSQARLIVRTASEIRRHLASGAVDPAFAPIPTSTATNGLVAYGVAIDSSDRIVVSGNIRGNDNVRRGYVIRYTTSGTVDMTFGSNGAMQIPVTSARTPAIGSDGRIVVAGTESTINQPDAPVTVIRLTSGGQLDATFNPGGSVPGVATAPSGAFTVAEGVTIDSLGGVVVVGSTIPAPAGCCTPAVMIRFGVTGQLDTAFTAAANAAVAPLAGFRDIATRPDGRLVIAGRRLDGRENTGQPTGTSNGTAVVVVLEATGAPSTGLGWDGMVDGTLALPGLVWPDTDMVIDDMVVRSDGAIALGGGASESGAAIAVLAARTL